MSSSSCFFGIILNLGRMKGNFFTNSIFAFAGEMISETFTGYLSGIYGRLTIMKYSVFLGSTSFLLYVIVPNSLKFIMIFLAMMGYAGVFNVVSIYTPEIFPTPIRGTTCSLLLLICRFSPLLVPLFTHLLGDHINFSFVIAGYLSGIACYGLNESLGQPLPDVIPEEIEKKSFWSQNSLIYSDKFDIISKSQSIKNLSFRI